MKQNPSIYATIVAEYAASRAGADADQTVTPSPNTPRIWVTKETLRCQTVTSRRLTYREIKRLNNVQKLMEKRQKKCGIPLTILDYMTDDDR